MSRACLVIIFLSVVVASAASQAPLTSTATESEANAAYTAHNWIEAESLYASLTKQQPENARFWFRLGVSQRGARHDAPALESFEKARKLSAGKGLPAFTVDYEVATTYAAMGNSSEALKALKASAAAGFFQPDRLESDSEWNSLRSDEQFQSLARQIKHNAAPCDDAEFRQFDFWIGDWDVTSTGDQVPRGASHISREMGGCVIWENWTSAGSPYFGKSYNTYNVNLHRWEQYWVDNSAGTIFFYGNLKDGVMDYWTDDIPQPNGDKLRRHLQFFNLSPDSVRQFSQGSTDGGKTWNVEYDLTYHRHETKNARAQ
jgi:tetratricopeptide (TPR) repeat protein